MKTVVLSFGRLNPVTTGHAKLADKIKSVARKENATPMLFVSHSQDPKKNPLSYNDKIKYAKLAFGPMVQKSKARTLIEVLKTLDGKFDRVLVVVGSDRTKEFDSLLSKYNGKDYNFDSIEVVSAGERDPDATDVSGMSASKLRKLAANGDLKAFTSGLPQKLKSKATEIYNKVRSGMNISEALTMAQRRKRKMIMRKMKNKIKRGKKIAARKKASPDKINKRAEKQARNMLKKKLSGGKSNLTYSQREKIEKRLETKKGKIKALAKKLKPSVRKKEVERMKNRNKKEEVELSDLVTMVNEVHNDQLAESMLKGNKAKKVIAKLNKMKNDDAEMAAFLVDQGDEKELQKFLKKLSPRSRKEIESVLSESLVVEKLSKDDPIEKWIKDFVDSDDSRFEGKSKKERIEMAKGAYYGAQKEETELTEASKTIKISFVSDTLKRKWMKKQNITPKEIIKQDKAYLEVPAHMSDYTKKKDHPEIYQVTESKTRRKRGTGKIKGKNYPVRVKTKKKYMNQVAPKVVEELENAMKQYVHADSVIDYNKFTKELKMRLGVHGLKFPEDRDDITSTVTTNIDFSKSRITWSTSGPSINITYEFSVGVVTSVENPEYGDIDTMDGKSMHTLMMQYYPETSKLTLTGLETRFVRG